jgi:gliding motility-associated-like protein
VSWTDPFDSFYANGTTYQPSQSLAAGTYTVLCSQGNSSWCRSYATSALLAIHPNPTADAGNNITICPGFSVNLSASGGTNYMWSPSATLSNANISNPTASPATNTSYQVIVVDGNNCKDKDSVAVFVILNDTCGVSIYNLISPNGDGKNDVWFIDGVNFFPENSVNIYNRWGDRVWQGKNYDNDKVLWSGQDQKGAALPDGTYYYVVELGDKTFSGFVELVR